MQRLRSREEPVGGLSASTMFGGVREYKTDFFGTSLDSEPMSHRDSDLPGPRLLLIIGHAENEPVHEVALDQCYLIYPTLCL